MVKFPVPGGRWAMGEADVIYHVKNWCGRRWRRREIFAREIIYWKRLAAKAWNIYFVFTF
jgi:hypothetical protein